MQGIFLIVFFLNLIFIGVFLLKQYEKLDLLQFLLYLCNIFIWEYCVVAAMLLAGNFFSVFNTLFILGSINIFINVVKRGKKKAEIEVSREDIYFFTFIFVLLPWIALKGQTLRTGSDAGFYYSKAIDLMFGGTENIKWIEDTGNITDAMVQSKTFLLGEQYFNISQADGQIYYMYHSLYIWPAIMALVGNVFGQDKITISMSIFYVLTLGNMWYILKRVSRLSISKFIVFPLFGFAPVIIYLAKLTFSELLFVSVLTAGILFLSDNQNKWNYFAGFMFGILPAIHFSAVMYLPIVFILTTYIGIIKKEENYFTLTQVGVGTFALFFLLNFKIAPMYSTNQMIASFGSKLDFKIWLFIILMVSVIGLFLLQILKKIGLRCSRFVNIFELGRRNSQTFLQIVVVILIVSILYKGYQLGFTDKMILGKGSWQGRAGYANKGWESLWHMNIYSIFLGLSYIGLPYILYKIFKAKNWDDKDCLLSIAFLYAVSIYTFIRSDTPSNYYGSRYFAIFLIPIAVITIGSMIKSRREFFIIAAIAICTALPYNIFLQKEYGYQGSYDILKDALDNIEENSAVLLDVNQNCIQILANNLEEINQNTVWGADVYDDVKECYSDIPIYFISNTSRDDLGGEEILHKRYKTSGDIACFDNATDIVKYPLNTRYAIEEVFIYRFQ